ncbi:SCO family protein [Halalkalibaculum sp. DA384]|uniref:SCO family protein n=1 Tax=Halalkalibaculum sp. DA384 TaxID=3373606 RepID=UPI0037541124
MKYHIITVILLSIAVIFGSCTGGEDTAPRHSPPDEMNRSNGEHAAHTNMEMDSGEPTDESIYNVSSLWQNRHGDSVELRTLRGRVQVVAMVYTHCEHACPRILADMKRIRDQLPAEARSATNFTIISIDPERDTPGRLTEFAIENDLSDDEWTLLNGNQGDVLEIAALLGVKYKRISETDFTHSNMITVLNREGEIVHQREKLQDQPGKIVKIIGQHVSG